MHVYFIVSASSPMNNFGRWIGLGIVSSIQQLRITKIVFLISRITCEVQQLQEVKVKIGCSLCMTTYVHPTTLIVESLTPRCPRSQNMVVRICQRLISQGKLFSFLGFFLHFDIIKFSTIQRKIYINESKISTLKRFEPSTFFLCYKLQLILGSNDVSDMNIFGFFHQTIQLIFLANHIADQVLFVHLGIIIIC